MFVPANFFNPISTIMLIEYIPDVDWPSIYWLPYTIVLQHCVKVLSKTLGQSNFLSLVMIMLYNYSNVYIRENLFYIHIRIKIFIDHWLEHQQFVVVDILFILISPVLKINICFLTCLHLFCWFPRLIWKTQQNAWCLFIPMC